MAFYLNGIPGYREALTRARNGEFKTREDNWLALPQMIAGAKVRIMTVRDYVALLRLQSPFLVHTVPSFEELGTFLWLLSPQIERWHNHEGWRKPWLVGCRWNLFSIEHWQIRLAAKRLRRRLKMTKLEKTAKAWNQANPGKTYELPDDCPLATAIEETFAYVDKVFFDRPSTLAQAGNSSGLLYLTSWFDVIQSQYHLPDEAVWKMPLPVLFGRMKAIQQRLNPGEPDFNRRQDDLARQLQAAMQSGQYTEQDAKAGKRFDFKDN
jgi:hypothetical protein